MTLRSSGKCLAGEFAAFELPSSQVKVELTHHELVDFEWKNTKSLVFVMDELVDPVKKEGKRRKTKGPEYTSRNFGAFMNISKLKNCTALTLAWRIRPLKPAVLSRNHLAREG